MKPLIALAGRPVDKGEVEGWPLTSAVAAASTYIDAIQRAGGQEAVLMPRQIDESDAEDLISRFDGVLLMGGGDLDPKHYGQEPVPEVYGISRERDDFEIAIARTAVRMQVPLLAICRGIQVLNVALGGTLHQHITVIGSPTSHGSGTEWATHAVQLQEGSRLADIVGSTVVSACASHHHQAIQNLAPSLKAVGWSDDGVIEAVESEEDSILAVQWHPELTAATDPVQQSLFDELVRLATRKSSVSPGR